MKKYIITTLLFFLALGVVLYLVNPFAPLLLLASLVVQAPIAYLIAKYSYSCGYAQRSQARKEQFEQDGDAAEWLRKERQEAQSIGFRLLSPKAKAQNYLRRAQLLVRMGQKEEAEPIFQALEPDRLSEEDTREYQKLKYAIYAKEA